MGIAVRRMCAVGAVAFTVYASSLAAADNSTVRGRITCRGLRDCSGAVVYVERTPGRAWAPGPPVVMDQANLTFVPHVLPVMRGTTVVFPNSDDVRHNVFSASPTKRFNLGTYPKGVTRRLTFETPGVVELLCNVHAEMSAFIVVIDSPYSATVQVDGAYELAQVPAGTFDVVVWHERLTSQRRVVTVGDRETAVLNFDLR